MARIRFGDERRLVLKLSSWNVRRLDTIRAAFPGVPLVWVQREPAAVMRSLLRARPGWLERDRLQRLAPHLFGIPAELAASLGEAALCVRALRALLDSAASSDAAIVDYRDLPAAVWRDVAPRFGMPIDDADLARMREEAQYSAKEPGRVRFSDVASPSPSAEIEALAVEWLDAAYERLGRSSEVACSS
jgi:hypothetical protein